MDRAESQDPTIRDPAEPTIPCDAPVPGTERVDRLLCAPCGRVYPPLAREAARQAACPLCGGALRPVLAGAHLDVPSARPQPADGQRFGRYLLRRELGRGGMGVVHEAWDTQLNRTVALKMLSSSGGHLDEKAAARLLREARSAARLHHPGIVAIHDVGECDGRAYYTMDLLDGRALEDLLRGDESWACFPLRRRIEVLAQVAQALGYAHAQGIIHRDVKPSNVMVDSQGRAMLLDFGLAKELSATELGEDLTVSGAVIGTPRYMSPEQAGGGLAGPRSDVFSFGVLLYRALTGTLPFEGEGIEAIFAILSTDPAPPSRVNARVHRDLETITMRCLEKDPTRRFADGAELAADLGRWIDGEPILSRPTPWIERAWRRAVKRRAVVVPSVLAAILGAVLWVVLHDRGDMARIAGEADAGRRAAEGREQRQAEALSLIEQARAAYTQVQLTFYDRDAGMEEVLDRVTAAQALIEKAIGLCPDLAPAHHLMGLGWEVRGWDDRAEASYRRALSIDARFAPSHYRLGRMFFERAFLATLTGPSAQHDLGVPHAREWAKSAGEELQAALDDGSGLEDDVQRRAAQAMAAYAARDENRLVRIVDEGLSLYGRASGREDLLWLRGIARVWGEHRAGPDDSFDQAIAIRPKFALALFCRAHMRGEGGDRAGALADYDEAIRVSPRFATAYANRADLRLRNGDQTAALADFEAALTIDPLHAPALVGRAQVRASRGDHEGALADLDSAIGANPSYAPAYVSRAELWLQKGGARNALADGDTALGLDPRSLEAFINRGTAKLELRDLEGALADFQAAIRIAPRSPAALCGRAGCHSRRGDDAAALADLDRAVECDPSHAVSLANRGMVRARLGDLAGARADFDAAIERDASFFDAWLNRGAHRARQGDLGGALADIEEAVRLRPDSAMALTARGGLKAISGDSKGAIADYDQAIRANPAWVEAWRNRAIVRSQTGDMKGALADCDEAVKREPDNLAALGTRGALRAGAGDNEGAIVDLNAVLARNARDLRSLLSRGNAKSALGDSRGALADYEAACEVAPESPEANANCGLTHLALGEREAAGKRLEKALQVAPAGWASRDQIERSLAELRRPK